MDIVWSEKIDEILCVGRYLAPFGIRNWGLTRPQALIALGELASEGVAVLGGDVLAETNGAIRMTNDGWSCDRKEVETKEGYVERSTSEARRYIIRYPQSTEGSLYFAIVPE